MNPTESPQRAITVKATFEPGQPPADGSASVFVFDPRGTLVTSAPLKGGQAAISVPQSLGASARVVVGPTPQQTGRPVTFDSLQRLRGFQPAVTLDAKSATLDLKTIPQAIYKYWQWKHCVIRGKVVTSLPGGEYPVCNARVRVCNVEPVWLMLQKLQPQHLLSLRDHVLHTGIQPPVPQPPPPPVLRQGATPSALSPAPQQPSVQLSAAQLSTAQLASKLQANVPPITAAQSLPPQAVAALSSSSPALIRSALLANATVLRPYLCAWPLFWFLFNQCEEIGTAITNDHGIFELEDTEIDGNDEDLYFSVDYSIDGIWTSVYAPPVPCNVYWDYVCGTEVKINITDPRVPGCGGPPDLPGKAVELTSIGLDFSPPQIDGNTGLTTGGAPFAGSIEPHVEFSTGALIGSGITHYRWSYRRMTTGDGATDAGVTAFTPITTPVYRHFQVIVPGSNPPIMALPAELMGPDPDPPLLGKNLFKIQPQAGPGNGWAVNGSNARTDTASAFFLTDLLDHGNPDNAAGKYELKLELFRRTAPDTPVNFTDEHITPSTATTPAPFPSGGTINAAVADDQHVFKVAGKVVAMRWVLHVDNNVCHGNISDVQGATLGPCGFYTIPSENAPVTVSFTASHPHQFATFAFNMARGSSGVIGNLSAHGAVDAAAAGGYTRSGTTFSRTFVAHDLFNIVDTGPPPGCDRGAFAAYLYVYAMATDGWGGPGGLDGPRGGPAEIGLKAFALMP